MLTKDDIHTVANVVITDPIQADLLPRSCTIQRFAAFDVVQVKEKNYCNRHFTDQFLPLAIEAFGCLNKHVEVFLHNCVNAIWSLKGLEGLHISTLVTFLCKFFLITLQKMYVSSILKSGDN